MHLLKNHCVHSSFWPGRPQAAVHLPAWDSTGREVLWIVVYRARVLTLWSWWVSSNSAVILRLLCGMWTCGWVSVTPQRVREQPHSDWLHSPENPWLCVDTVQTYKCHLPNCNNGISAICELTLWDCVAQSPVYVCPKKQLLAFFPMVISKYWSFILPSAEEDDSVKLNILKYSWQRGIKLQIMLISLPHSCVFRSYIKSHIEIVIATEQNWSN